MTITEKQSDSLLSLLSIGDDVPTVYSDHGRIIAIVYNGPTQSHRYYRWNDERDAWVRAKIGLVE